MSEQGKWSDPSEFLKVCGLEEWTFERAEKMAKSFQTPLHRNFQLTCEYARTLQAEIHRLRGRLSHYESVGEWNK